jgi:hypothetical protein
MFFPGSRYASLGTYYARRLDGSTVLVTRLPKPVAGPLLGYHRRLSGQRLDHIAAHYLTDPTGFWRLCDANDAVVPDALAAAELVGVPAPGR